MPTELINFLLCLLLAMLPVSELRGAIPFALDRGLEPWLAIPLAIIGNLAIAPLAYFFLGYLHHYFNHFTPYRWLMAKVSVSARRRIDNMLKRFGFWGLLLFVGIPLPITGAWTAVLGAWLLDLERKKSIWAISLGVMMSAAIVSSLTLLGFSLLGD